MKYEILEIADDASFRRFYRFVSNKRSKIIVLATKEKYKNLVAYSAINKFLRNNKILAPKLYSHDYSKGIIIIEDFGGTSFHSVLLKKKNQLPIYKKLVNLLIKIQKIKPKNRVDIQFQYSKLMDSRKVKIVGFGKWKDYKFNEI